MPDDGMSSGTSSTGGGDAASVMQATISEFQGQGGGESSPAAAPAPAPTPPSVPGDVPGTPPDPPAASTGQEVNWYEALLAESEDRPDELTALINEESFNGLRANPEQLGEWAQRAFGQLKQFGEGAERQRALEARAGYAGGWENAEHAFDLFGDLYRGDIPLSEADRADFPEAQSYSERALMRVMKQDPTTAYSLGAAVLNHMPELVKHNADYLMRSLGLDPKFAEDYKRVAEAGGFKMSEDQQVVHDWFKANDIPLDQLETFESLPVDLRHDMLAGKPQVSKYHLNNYHKDRVSEQRAAKANEARMAQERERVEYQSAQTLATEQRKVYQEYVDKGRALGLNDLEAAGLAAMAYSEIEQGFWDEASDSRKVIDDWHGHIKTGNKLQSDTGRSSYRKAFEAAYRKAAGQYKTKRAGVTPTEPTKQPGALNGNTAPTFTPGAPPDARFNGLTGEALMNEILRSQGAIT